MKTMPVTSDQFSGSFVSNMHADLQILLQAASNHKAISESDQLILIL